MAYEKKYNVKFKGKGMSIRFRDDTCSSAPQKTKKKGERANQGIIFLLDIFCFYILSSTML